MSRNGPARGSPRVHGLVRPQRAPCAPSAITGNTRCGGEILSLTPECRHVRRRSNVMQSTHGPEPRGLQH